MPENSKVMIGGNFTMQHDVGNMSEAQLPIVEQSQSYDGINVTAAIERSKTLIFIRFSQDLVSRTSVILILIAALPSTRQLSTAGLILIFCAIWFVSRERLIDTIDQIENAFIRRAQGQHGATETARWEYFLAAVGARATSRKSISVFEKILRFEPLIWGGIGMILSAAVSIFG